MNIPCPSCPSCPPCLSAPQETLPIHEVLPELLRTLTRQTRCILEAPPGAGKTTRVPLALLTEAWLSGRGILMLEPRRMAARNAARYMAALLGEEVGQTVGYRVRLDSKVSRHTRITVVTEGILTRLIQDDPELRTTGCLLFDEFHERNLHGDLGLALALDCQQALREDLRIVVMSATLDSEPLARLLEPFHAAKALKTPSECGDEAESNVDAVPILRCEGRIWPVATHYLPSRQTANTRPERHVAEVVRLALREQTGSLLVFLPGAGEIRNVEALLEDVRSADIAIYPLYGDLPFAAQEAAIAPPSASLVKGRNSGSSASSGSAPRKIVLATSIAETSLTIEGVRVVIDAGLARVPRFDAGTGMSRLVTERVSRAGAEQRRGRAGRTEPGVCYRLWSQGEEVGLQAHIRPEILEADLAPLCLELAVWGVNDPAALRWLDTPPAETFRQARRLLHELDAVDARGHATERGRVMARLPLHPRLAHMVLEAGEMALHDSACLLSALAGERDPLPRSIYGVDARARLALLMGDRSEAIEGHGMQLRRVREAARQIARLSPVLTKASIKTPLEESGHPENCAGLLLALAYPDRVAQKRERGSFRMVNGRGAFLDSGDPLADEPFLALGELSGDSGNARIYQAAPLALTDLQTLFGSRMENRDIVVWDSREEAVIARKQRCLGALILEDAPLVPSADTAEAVCKAALEGIRSLGLSCLPWTEELVQWQQRILFLRTLESTSGTDDGSSLWPDISEAALLNSLEEWLEPFMQGISRRTHFKKMALDAALHALLPWSLQRRLDAEAPTHLEVPSGSRIRLNYAGMLSGTGNTGTVASIPSDPVPALKLQAGPVPALKLQAGPVPALKLQAGPVLAVKLQELFGLANTPVVAGNVPVVVHLLSPAGRPLQITRDLAGFWRNGYPAVRAEMRGRYPRHPWPDDPVAAVPTRFTKKRTEAQCSKSEKPSP